MLVIHHPDTYLPERHYIFEVVLRRFLRLTYRTAAEQRDDVLITREDDAASSLAITDVLFQTPAAQWLTLAAMPQQPLKQWDAGKIVPEATLISPQVPVIYGQTLANGDYAAVNPKRIEIGLDIFGSAFFCLTRYEEILKPQRDPHGRFMAADSLAFQEGFIERPIVNEYVEILWVLIRRLWAGLERQVRQSRVFISCDVDLPRCDDAKTPFQVVRSMGADVIQRRDAGLSLRRGAAYALRRRDDDPCNNLDWIMTQAENYGFQEAFYFIADHPMGIMDCSYSVDDDWIRALWRDMQRRGHQIGLHPSYTTFNNAEQLQREKTNLTRALHEEKIEPAIWGGRQHFLRWDNPVTWQLWDDGGMDYDSTLSFANHAGFRCGTCYEYPVFNLQTHQPLRLRERPLIVMEVTLLNYMKLSLDEAVEHITALNQICRRFNGDFTLLWHNNTLISRQQKSAYVKALATLAG